MVKAVVMEQILGQAGKFGAIWPDTDPPNEYGTWIVRNVTKEQAERACSLTNDSIAKPYEYFELSDAISPIVMCRIIVQLSKEFNMTVEELLDSPWWRPGESERVYKFAAMEVKKEERS